MNVFHGPIEISGQVINYSKALRKAGQNATTVVFEPHKYGYDHDELIYPDGFPGQWRSRCRRVFYTGSALRRFDVFNYWFGRTILGGIDLRAASAMRKTVVMTFCGSEIRPIRSASEKSPFIDAGNWPRSSVDTDYLRWLNRHIDAAIIQYHELKPYVDEYFDRVELVPRAVDCDEIRAKPSTSDGNRIRVAHAPSNREIKGTKQIEEAVTKLQNDGYDIELQVVEGNHDTVIQQLQTADIVVDQLRLGTFGVVALEAMAAGTPVICYIRDDLREQYPNSLPIVNATPESIESVLKKLVSNSERRLELSATGRDYVEEFHSLPVVGERLIELYSSLGAD